MKIQTAKTGSLTKETATLGENKCHHRQPFTPPSLPLWTRHKLPVRPTQELLKDTFSLEILSLLAFKPLLTASLHYNKFTLPKRQTLWHSSHYSPTKSSIFLSMSLLMLLLHSETFLLCLIWPCTLAASHSGYLTFETWLDWTEMNSKCKIHIEFWRPGTKKIWKYCLFVF